MMYLTAKEKTIFERSKTEDDFYNQYRHYCDIGCSGSYAPFYTIDDFEKLSNTGIFSELMTKDKLMNMYILALGLILIELFYKNEIAYKILNSVHEKIKNLKKSSPRFFLETSSDTSKEHDNYKDVYDNLYNTIIIDICNKENFIDNSDFVYFSIIKYIISKLLSPNYSENIKMEPNKILETIF